MGEDLGFIDGIAAMYDDCALVVPTGHWPGWWDDRCVMTFDFRDFADDKGYFKVVKPKEVTPLGGIVYDKSCVIGEYRFTAWEMLNLRFRRTGPWFHEVWKKAVADLGDSKVCFLEEKEEK